MHFHAPRKSDNPETSFTPFFQCTEWSKTQTFCYFQSTYLQNGPHAAVVLRLYSVLAVFCLPHHLNITVEVLLCCPLIRIEMFKKKKKFKNHNQNNCMNCINVYPQCCDILLCSSENQINLSKVLSSQANMQLRMHTRWFCSHSPLQAIRGHAWRPRRSTSCLPAGSLRWLIWMAVLSNCMFAGQDSECACA